MVETVQAWLRRNVRWSNSRQSWEERLAGVLLVGGVAMLVWLHGSFSPGVAIALWAGLILTGALLLRRGWLKLFGPVLFYDLVRLSRRRVHLLLRWGYVMLLAVLIGWLYCVWRLDFDYREPSRNELILLNSQLFYTFMTLQFTMIVLVTPAYTAGSVAEEKDRKTLEFLLATDLRDREIVLGKMLSRLFTILLIVLAGLPILSILQLLGGVGPDLVFWGFAASVASIAGIAGLSIASSVIARRSRDAILLTYLGMFVYVGLSATLYFSAMIPQVAGVLNNGINWSLPWPEGWRIAFTLQDVVEWLSCGNPGIAVFELFVASGGNVTAALPSVLPRYLIFHGLVGILLPAWAVWRMRPMVLKETYGTTGRLPLWWRLFRRPAVGSWPMLWKELFVEPGMKFGLIVKIILGIILIVLVLGSFTPPGVMIGIAIYEEQEQKQLPKYREEYKSLMQKRDKLENKTLDPADQARARDLANRMRSARFFGIRRWLPTASNAWMRTVGSAVSMLMLLFVAVRAAGSLSGEKDRQTLNELLTSPLSAESILYSKWLGAVLSVRWCWLWLGTIWLVAMVMGGLYFWTIPYLVFAWFVYALGAAGIGMWFSAHSKTSLRAIIWTILVLLFVSGGHWIATALFCYLPLGLSHSAHHEIEDLARIQAGQTPPFVFAWLGFFSGQFERSASLSKEDLELTISSLAGLATWTVGTVIVAVGLLYRFRRLTNRSGYMRPERRRRPSTGHRAVPPYKERIHDREG